MVGALSAFIMVLNKLNDEAEVLKPQEKLLWCQPHSCSVQYGGF